MKVHGKKTTDFHIHDTRLVDLLQGDSQEAFNMIYDIYAERIFRYVLVCTKSKEDAEEIVQDVFVFLWNYRKELRRDTDLNKLLFSVAKKYRIDAFRRLIKSPVFADYINYCDSIASHQEDRVEFSEALSHLKNALHKLPSNLRRVVYLSKIKNLTIQEITIATGYKEKTVRNYLSEGLKRLKMDFTKLLTFFFL